MKITLIDPSRYLDSGKLHKPKRLFSPSLTLPLLAALTPDDVEVSIVNEVFEDINFDHEADVIGITSYTTNIHRAYQVADEFRRRNVPVVMGGMHVSMEPEEAQEHTDTIIIGEAEETWPQFINDFRNGIRKNVYEARERPSLANLPMPRFSLLDQSKYVTFKKQGLSGFFLKTMIPIETARGCPYSCDFCTVTKFFGGQYRPRPISDVINEIKALEAKICYFIDDNIFASPARAKELFKALIPLKINWISQATIGAVEDKELIELARKSGCLFLCIGLESLSRTNLVSMGKKINKVENYAKYLKAYSDAGIIVGVTMMFGFDDDEPGVFKEAYDFLVKNHVPLTAWQAIRPQPGTALYKRLKDQGRLKDNKWWLSPDVKTCYLQYTGTKMDEEVFAKNFNYYYNHFFSLGSIIKRTLLPPQKRFLLQLLFNLIYRRNLTSEAFYQ